MALFEVIHERFDGHPCSREYRNAAKDGTVAGDEILFIHRFGLRARLYHNLPLPTIHVQWDQPHEGNRSKTAVGAGRSSRCEGQTQGKAHDGGGPALLSSRA